MCALATLFIKKGIYMKDKIEAKIEAHVKSILKKDAIDFSDYQILVGELGRIAAKESAQKWEDEKEERNEQLAAMMKTVMKI